MFCVMGGATPRAAKSVFAVPRLAWTACEDWFPEVGFAAEVPPAQAAQQVECNGSRKYKEDNDSPDQSSVEKENLQRPRAFPAPQCSDP